MRLPAGHLIGDDDHQENAPLFIRMTSFLNWGASSRWSSSQYCPMGNSDDREDAPHFTKKLRWKDSSLDLRIPEDATEDWIKEEIFLQETILNKLHNYMQGKKV